MIFSALRISPSRFRMSVVRTAKKIAVERLERTLMKIRNWVWELPGLLTPGPTARTKLLQEYTRFSWFLARPQ
jgi:hypothetical protein